MPRPIQSLDDIIKAALTEAMQKVEPAIQRHVATLAAEELERRLDAKRGSKLPRGPARRARPRGEAITKWVADRSARRVPKFVIELTGGLDTKKKIVAKFGEGVTFEKGKPVPKPSKAA